MKILRYRPLHQAHGTAALLSCATLTFACPGWAQTGDGETALDTMTVQAQAIADSAIGPDSSSVAERTLTGTKMDTELVNLSRSVSVVTEEEMRTRGVRDLEQALSYTAGVAANQYASDNRYDFFMIRGFNQTSLGTYRDGLNRRTVNFTGGKLEPYGLQRIDVLKGSTSTLFGLNAPGGLVNAITKRPLDYEFGEVYTTIGTDDHAETGADFGGLIDEAGKWRYRVTTKWQDADRTADHTQDDRVYFAPAITYQPDDATSLTLLADYNKRDSNASQLVPYGQGIDPETFLGEPDFDGMDSIERNVGYLFEHDFGNGLSFRQNARYTNLDLDYESVYLNAADPANNRTATGVYGNRDRYAIDNQLQYDTQWNGIGSRTLVGIDYTHDDVSEEQYYAGTAGGIDVHSPSYCGSACIDLGEATYLDQQQTSQGFYLQEELTLAERWILTLGGRYDDVNTDYSRGDVAYDASDYAFTRRAGLTYKALDDLSIYANYAESFQPPSGRTTIAGGADPQEGEQYEVGMKYRPANTHALFTVALFDLTQTNVQSQVSPTLYRQTGEVNVRGIELEGKLALSDRLNVSAAYSYWDSEIEEDGIGGNQGNRPSLVPEHIASLWTDYTLPGKAGLGDLTLGGGVRYIGSTYVDDANSRKVSSYTLVDAMANYALTPSVDLAVNATNLFDKEYVNYINTFSQDAAFYGDGRSVLTTLRYHW